MANPEEPTRPSEPHEHNDYSGSDVDEKKDDSDIESPPNGASGEENEKVREDGKVELKEDDCYDILAYS